MENGTTTWAPCLDVSATQQSSLPEYTRPPARGEPEPKQLDEISFYVSDTAPQRFLTEDADVLVQVKGAAGESDRLWLWASSKVLCSASIVWNRMINPRSGMREPETTRSPSGRTAKILECIDDDEQAVEIVLRAVHVSVDALYPVVTFDQLRSIALVVDKYDCVCPKWEPGSPTAFALNRWVYYWMGEHEKNALKPGHEDWIWITKVLEPERAVTKDVSIPLIFNSSSVSECKTYFFRYSDPGEEENQWEVEFDLIPEEILTQIVDQRSTAIKSLVKLLRCFVADICTTSDGQGGENRFCDDVHCLDTATGSLIRSLKSLKLWPLVNSDTPAEWHGSVNLLASRIADIKMNTMIRKRRPIEPEASARSRMGKLGRSHSFQGSSKFRSMSSGMISGSIQLDTTEKASPPIYQPVPEIRTKLLAATTTAWLRNIPVPDEYTATTIESLRLYHAVDEPNMAVFSESSMPCGAAVRYGKFLRDCKAVAEDVLWRL